jgi:membrane protein YdbS with pleckstrin-like domain
MEKYMVEKTLDVAIPATMVLVLAVCLYGMFFVGGLCSFIIGIPTIIVVLFVFVELYILDMKR